VQSNQFNVQGQTRVEWQPSTVVARAYLDQLTRSKAIAPARSAVVRSALERADRLRTGRERNAATVVDQLDALAGQLQGDAAAASGRDAARLRSLASTVKARASQLR
jgi:hypothetical protein